MNMKKTILIITLALLAITASANEMMHLLQGGYDAKVLTGDEAKRILGEEAMGRYRLEYENKQQLFRHSFLADYYLIDTHKNTRIRMSEQPVRDAVISPNGKYVVYAKADNNL